MSQTTAQPQVRPLAEALQSDDTVQLAPVADTVELTPAQVAEAAEDAAPTVQLPAVEETAEPETPADAEPEAEEPEAEPIPAADSAPVERPQLLTAAQEADAHAADVLKQLVVGAAPTPDSISLSTGKWPAPWISAQYFLNYDRSRLAAAQQVYGGEISRDDDMHRASGHVYFELLVRIDGVEVRFWTLVPAHLLATVGA